MLTNDAKRIFGILKKEGLSGFKQMSSIDKDMVIRANRKLFATERQVADPVTGIVETKMVLDWSVLTDEFVFDTLKEHGVV